MEEITARAILAKVVTTIMQSLPNKLTDKLALQLRVSELISSLPLVPETPLIRQIGQSLIIASPQCWGTHRSRAWWRIVLSALPLKEALELYIAQFPPQITAAQRASIRSYLLAMAKKRRLCGVNEEYIDSLLAGFKIRTNCPKIADHAFGIYLVH